jgi:hypothetical protein
MDLTQDTLECLMESELQCGRVWGDLIKIRLIGSCCTEKCGDR